MQDIASKRPPMKASSFGMISGQRVGKHINWKHAREPDIYGVGATAPPGVLIFS